MSEGAGRRGLVLLAAVVVGLLLWGGWNWWEMRRDRRAFAEIEEEIENGRHGIAARKLTDLLARRPGSDEALYVLGTCEHARGRNEQAAQAWARVQPGSRFAPQAILGRMQLEMEHGRLAEAERLITDALADPRIDGSSLPILLGPIYCQQGRQDETLRLLEVRWDRLNQAGEGASEPAINLVRAHIDLQQRPIPAEVIRAALDQAARLAPEDDRIWLGKANLAIRVGAHEEAAQWLDACLRRRPDDFAIWRARLGWALATNRVPEAQEAMKRLLARESTPAQVQRLAAWLAARRGDLASERRALERLVEADPADFAALDRLADLLAREGHPASVADVRRTKDEIDQHRARYQKLYARNQPLRDAAEMARLAEKLGRSFEAKVWLTVAAAVDPDRKDFRADLARLTQRDQTNSWPGRTLADVVAAELDRRDGRASSARASSVAGESSPAPISLPGVLGRPHPKSGPE
jgi:predicted Zn-dependent protease